MYFDYIIVMREDFDLSNMKEVFIRLKNAHLQLNAKNCALFQKKVNFLGDIVMAQGIATNLKQIKAVQQ